MLEYDFEQVAANKGFFVGKSLEHREIIQRRGKQGWRYCGFVPAEQVNGWITQIDLVFVREVNSNDSGTD